LSNRKSAHAGARICAVWSIRVAVNGFPWSHNGLRRRELETGHEKEGGQVGSGQSREGQVCHGKVASLYLPKGGEDSSASVRHRSCIICVLFPKLYRENAES
jgi:hypothetical protein